MSHRNSLGNRIKNRLFVTPTNEFEVINCTSRLSNKHFSGFDNLSVFVVKQIIVSIAAPLALIINKSFNFGIVP